MKSKVILFNPKAAEVGRFIGIPLAFLTIGSRIKDKYDVKIYDSTYDDVHNVVINECKDALCIAISAHTGYQIKDALKLARVLRKKYPDLPIIWGGPHPSLLPLQTIKDENVDFVVRGQGEETFRELLQAIEEKKSFDGILGLTYKENGNVKHNSERPIHGIDDYYPLPFNMVDVNRYITSSEIGSRTINYVTSYGCPWRCGFCSVMVVSNRRWMAASPKKVVDDMESLVKNFGVDSFIITDNNYFTDEKRVLEIAKEIIDRGLKIRYGRANGRADTLSRLKEETWKLLEKSGLDSVLIGAESGDQHTLDFMKKDGLVLDNLKATELCKKYHVRILYSFFIGLPNNKSSIEKEFNATVKHINELRKIEKNNFFYFFTYSPYPGTPLYQESIKAGFQEPKCLEDWANMELFMLSVPWIPKKVSDRAYQLNFYFPIISGNAAKIISNYPAPLKFAIKPFERGLYYLMNFRVKHLFFHFPIEYYSINFFVKYAGKIPFVRKIIVGNVG